MRRLGVLIVLLAATVGCTSTVAGQPAAEPASADSATSEIVLPPRPYELRVDGVDPCALLTPDQRSELGLDGRPIPYASETRFFVGRACSIGGYRPRAIGTNIVLVTGNDLQALIDVTPDAAVPQELSVVAVADFPGVVSRSEIVSFCSVSVDVADDQFVNIIFADDGEQQPIPQDQLCQEAMIVAEQALQTLKNGT